MQSGFECDISASHCFPVVSRRCASFDCFPAAFVSVFHFLWNFCCSDYKQQMCYGLLRSQILFPSTSIRASFVCYIMSDKILATSYLFVHNKRDNMLQHIKITANQNDVDEYQTSKKCCVTYSGYDGLKWKSSFTWMTLFFSLVTFMALCKFRTWCCFVFHTRALLVLSLIKQAMFL